MKKIIGIIVIAFVIIGILLIVRNSAGGPIGKVLFVTTFTSNGTPTGRALVQVPFTSTLSDGTLDVIVDTNHDGVFKDDERLISNAPVHPQADWRSGYYAVSKTPIADGMKARITVDGGTYDIPVQMKTVDIGTMFDFASTTDPENASLGWGIPVANAAASGTTAVMEDGTPDITQGKGECGPAAAANGIIALVAKHGGEDIVPSDPRNFVESLKTSMHWTPENGTLPDDFITGKNLWAAQAGIPISATKIGDAAGKATLSAIKSALQKGDAVEVRIAFEDPGSSAPVGGHIVSVVGLTEESGKTYLAINDPATPDSGTEEVEINGNTLVNYGPWPGTATLSWAFDQVWEGTSTGSFFKTMSETKIQDIERAFGETPMITVVEYGDKYLPVNQLTVKNNSACGADYWDASKNGSVTATDGTIVIEPNAQCGYGKVSDRPKVKIPAPDLSVSGSTN